MKFYHSGFYTYQSLQLFNTFKSHFIFKCILIFIFEIISTQILSSCHYFYWSLSLSSIVMIIILNRTQATHFSIKSQRSRLNFSSTSCLFLSLFMHAYCLPCCQRTFKEKNKWYRKTCAQNLFLKHLKHQKMRKKRLVFYWNMSCYLLWQTIMMTWFDFNCNRKKGKIPNRS